jgi:uncharacterized protein YecE (DUF72 family)
LKKPSVYAGTSGWAYPTWKPGFYPANVPSRKFLEHYATRLTSVEVNYTFRSLPTEAQLQGWLDVTPSDFRFSFKAPQRITHLRRLRGCEELLAEFLAALQPVTKARKNGALLFQFPPNFRAAALGKDKQPNLQALAAFLAASKKALKTSKWRVAMEFRDTSWFTDETYAILRKHGVALCEAESDDLTTPQMATSGFSYARMRASNYTESWLSAAAKRFRMQSANGPAFVYFKHEEAPDGPLRAEKLLKQITR